MTKNITENSYGGQRLRIKDIARMAGVSVGTVDRVLHKRGKVSEDKEKKILEIIEQNNFKPNVLASSLAGRGARRFVSLIPSFESGEYWNYIQQGIDKAQREIKIHNIVTEHRTFDQYDSDSFATETKKILASSPDAVIFSPVFIDESLEFAQKLDDKNIPCVLVDSNVEEIDCVAYYGQHSLKSGYTAAQLLFSGLPENTTVLLARSARLYSAGSNQAILREKGFMNYVREYKLDNKYAIERIELHSGNQPANIRRIKKIAAHKPISGAVIFSSKVHRLAYYFAQARVANAKIIGYDELPKNVAALKDGSVANLIAQRPEMQGYLGVKDLFKAIVQKQSTHRTNYVPVDILTKEIVDEYIEFNQRLNE